MSSNQQALLMVDDDGEAPPAPVTCVADPYYSCGPTNDPYWANVVLLFQQGNLADLSEYGRSLTSAYTTLDATLQHFGTDTFKISYNAFGQYGYIEIAASSDFTFATSDFCIEGFVRFNTTNTYWLYADAAGGGGAGLAIKLEGSSGILSIWYNGSSLGLTSQNVYFPLSEWFHVAVSRNGSAISGFINGVFTGSLNIGSTALNAPTSALRIGTPTAVITTGYFNLSGYRITKGVARYTGNFNIPTAAFPDAQGSLGLNTGLSEEWVDSFDNYTEAVSGDFSKFSIVAGTYGNAVRCASVSSGTFIIRRDFAETPADRIRFLFKINNANQAATQLAFRNRTTGNVALLFRPRDNSFYDASRRALVGWTTNRLGTGGVTALYLGTTALTVGDWHQFDLIANPGATSIIVTNLLTGAQIFGNYAASAITPTRLQFNVDNSGGGTGSETEYADIEVVNNTRTILSLHAEDTSDASCYQPKTVTLAGTAEVSAVETKFGAGSFSVANAGTSTANGVVISDHMDLDFGTGDFTIEMWAYRSANTYTGRLFYFTTSSTFAVDVSAVTNNITLYYSSTGGSQTVSAGVAFPLNTWQHVVVQRCGTNFLFFLDGALVKTTAISGGGTSAVNSTGSFYVGRSVSSSAISWNGYIDEVRITKGACRYSSSFDPATLPNCDSTTAGTGRTVDGTSPLTGASVTVSQQSISGQEAYKALQSERCVFVIPPGLSGDVGSTVCYDTLMTTRTGTITASSVNLDRTLALTGVSATVSRGFLTVPAYPSLSSTSITTIEIPPTAGTASLTARFFTDGTFVARDQNNAVRINTTWIDTTQTNYNISDISSQYRVIAVNVFLGPILKYTYTAPPFTLNSAFSIAVANSDAGVTNVFEFQVTIGPTTNNPRYGEAYYYGTHRVKASLGGPIA